MWEALGQIATALGVLASIALVLIKYWFRQQLKIEEAKQETAKAQRENIEAEKKVYEISMSQTIKEFNALKTNIRGKVILYLKRLEDIQAEINMVAERFDATQKELARFNQLFDEYTKKLETRISNLEDRTKDFGKVILKPEPKA